jgi:hypothetical protein
MFQMKALQSPRDPVSLIWLSRRFPQRTFNLFEDGDGDLFVGVSGGENPGLRKASIVAVEAEHIDITMELIVYYVHYNT